MGFYSASYKQNSLSISWESDLLVAIVVLSYSVAVRQAMMIGCVFASEAMAMSWGGVRTYHRRTISPFDLPQRFWVVCCVTLMSLMSLGGNND